MAFTKTHEYWKHKIRGIKLGIKGTKEQIPKLTDQRHIEAHKDQIKSYTKSLNATIAAYKKWRD